MLKSKVFLIILGVIALAVLAYAAYYFFTMRGVKVPKYTVLRKQGNIEIRRYAPVIMAQVTVDGDRDQVINKGFAY